MPVLKTGMAKTSWSGHGAKLNITCKRNSQALRLRFCNIMTVKNNKSSTINLGKLEVYCKTTKRMLSINQITRGQP